MNTCVKRKQNSKRIMVYEISHPILEVKLLLGEFYHFFTEPCLKVTVLCYEFPLKVFQVYRSWRQRCIQGKLTPGQDRGPAKLDKVIISLFCFQWESQTCDPVLFSAKDLYWLPLGVLTGEIISCLHFFFLFLTSIKGYSNHLVTMTWYTNACWGCRGGGWEQKHLGLDGSINPLNQPWAHIWRGFMTYKTSTFMT